MSDGKTLFEKRVRELKQQLLDVLLESPDDIKATDGLEYVIEQYDNYEIDMTYSEMLRVIDAYDLSGKATYFEEGSMSATEAIEAVVADHVRQTVKAWWLTEFKALKEANSSGAFEKSIIGLPYHQKLSKMIQHKVIQLNEVSKIGIIHQGNLHWGTIEQSIEDAFAEIVLKQFAEEITADDIYKRDPEFVLGMLYPTAASKERRPGFQVFGKSIVINPFLFDSRTNPRMMTVRDAIPVELCRYVVQDARRGLAIALKPQLGGAIRDLMADVMGWSVFSDEWIEYADKDNFVRYSLKVITDHIAKNLDAESSLLELIILCLPDIPTVIPSPPKPN